MRLLLAIWAAKLSTILGKIVGKKSTSVPGEIALRICPDLIRRLSKNIKNDIIVTCGTNGKTTTNNLLCSALTKCGFKVLCNNLGANMIGGVATTFAQECNIFGKLSADYACFEVDEASAVKVFDHLTPNYMIITNLFCDQLDRYGEIAITANLLKSAILKADGVKLILNGDDPLTAQFGKESASVYFGISEAVLPQSDESRESQFCPFCGTKQEYNYYHYSQLGDYYCPNCNNSRPKIDYEATEVNIKDTLAFSVNKNKISLNYRGFYNIYNVLAVYSVLSELGVIPKDFSSVFSDYKPQIGRMEEFNLGKSVILNLAKNPAGFNQAISTVLQDSRKKDVIISINDKPGDGLDVSWLWSVDFECLADENLNSLTTNGIRIYDLSLRFKYSNIKVDHICHSMREAIENCLKTDAEVCYILVNYTALFDTQNILLDIQKNLKEGK